MLCRDVALICAKTVLSLALLAVVSIGLETVQQVSTQDRQTVQRRKLVPTGARDFADVESNCAGDLRDDNGLRMPLRWCPPAEFTMGSPPDEPGRHRNEMRVATSLRHGFWIGQFEVTQREWRSVMESSPWVGRSAVKHGASYPATWVSWGGATTFCARLTEREHRSGRLPRHWVYRLPTEAEWESACRAGTRGSYSFGDDSAKLGEFGWYGAIFGNGSADGEEYAHPVGRKLANPWNLHDMYGNVREWCHDAYREILIGGVNPVIRTGDSRRVVRGGSWGNCAFGYCRSADRHWSPSSHRDSFTGFRIVCCRAEATSLPESEPDDGHRVPIPNRDHTRRGQEQVSTRERRTDQVAE